LLNRSLFCNIALMKRIIIALTIAALMVPAGAEARRKPKPFTHETVEIPSIEPEVIGISTANTSLVLFVREDRVLFTQHYGCKVEDPQEYRHFRTARFEENGNGNYAYPATGGRFVGNPALHVRYADGNHNTDLRYQEHSVRSAGNIVTTEILLKDYVTLLEVKLIYEAYRKEDVIIQHTEIKNAGKTAVELLNYASGSLYVDADRYLLTHFYGAWAHEMQVERELLGHDTKVIESLRGVQSTQSNNPSFMISLNTGEFSETQGEVIAGALQWTGNFRLSFTRDESGKLNILGGISPFASAYPLKAGETFETPGMIWTWSCEGAGGASRQLHRWARDYGVYAGGNVNPTLLNSWEGAYFNFTTRTLTDMIDDAAAMGLEMFVLDDGWFGNAFPRNSDKAGLGDWQVNVSKLPEGIDYVASYAHSKGLKFGIWIEPEMVNPASELAAAHPEWIVQSPGRENTQIRNQWILDLANPAVQDFIYGVFDSTMQLSPSIDYVKWDCNRIVESFFSNYLGKEQDRFYVEYVQGFYKVIRRIREKYPHVIVQCCSSGGARVDYGALRYFNEVWASDDTDAEIRVHVQYATSLIYPPFIMGAHVSAVPNHQTRNVTPLKFRFDVACSGRLGMELQPKQLSQADRALADRCITSYKQYRDLIFQGDLYRLASPEDGPWYALMYVSEDKSRAVAFTYSTEFQVRDTGGHSFRLQGLDENRRYKVTELNVDNSCWWGSGSTFSGNFLQSGGFNPVLQQKYASAVFYLEAQ